MEPPDQAPHSLEHSLAGLLRAVLFVIEPYASGKGSRAEVCELANVMRQAIDALERVDDATEGNGPICPTSLQ
jgi:hypothetical protein